MWYTGPGSIPGITMVESKRVLVRLRPPPTLKFSERRSMWIPFELGQTVYVVVDNGYNTEHTIHDGYDHLGEIVRRETVHHPLLEVEPRRFNLQMLAYCGLDNIYATQEEAETHLKK